MRRLLLHKQQLRRHRPRLPRALAPLQMRVEPTLQRAASSGPRPGRVLPMRHRRRHHAAPPLPPSQAHLPCSVDSRSSSVPARAEAREGDQVPHPAATSSAPPAPGTRGTIPTTRVQAGREVDRAARRAPGVPCIPLAPATRRRRAAHDPALPEPAVHVPDSGHAQAWVRVRADPAQVPACRPRARRRVRKGRVGPRAGDASNTRRSRKAR